MVPDVFRDKSGITVNKNEINAGGIRRYHWHFCIKGFLHKSVTENNLMNAYKSDIILLYGF